MIASSRSGVVARNCAALRRRTLCVSATPADPQPPPQARELTNAQSGTLQPNAASMIAERERYATELKKLASEADVDGVRAVLSKMALEGIVPDASANKALIEAYSEAKDVVGSVLAFEEIETMSGPADDELHMALLSSLHKNGCGVEEASAAILSFRQTKNSPTPSKKRQLQFRLMMKSYAQQAQVADVLGLIKLMERSKLPVGVEESKILCEAYARVGNADAAEAELEASHRHSPAQVDQSFYAVVARVRDDVSWIERCRSTLRAREVALGAEFVEAAVNVLLRHNFPQRARELLAEADVSTARTLHDLYPRIIEALGRADDIAAAEAVLRADTVAKGVPPSVAMQRALLEAYARRGNADAAEALLGELKAGLEREKDGLRDTDVAAAIRSCAAARDVKRAEAYVRKLAAYGLSAGASGAILCAMLEVYGRSGEETSARALMYKLRQCSARDVDTRAYDWVLLAQVLKGELRAAVDTFDWLLRVKCAPRESVLRRLLMALARAGDAERCEDVLVRSHTRSVSCWNTAVLAYCRRQQHEQVLRVLKMMRARAILPDECTRRWLKIFTDQLRDEARRAFLAGLREVVQAKGGARRSGKLAL